MKKSYPESIQTSTKLIHNLTQYLRSTSLFGLTEGESRRRYF